MENIAKDLNAHPDFFIPFDARLPDDTYYDHVTSLLPAVWRMKQDYFWTYVHPREGNKMMQGWKIHVSTLPDRAFHTLDKVVSICVAHDTEFKFASDPKILKQLLSKTCSRSSSGKFATIYPKDVTTFKSILEALYQELKDEKGPYILSDKPYRDSKVIYFRYGGFKSLSGQTVDGEKTAYILNDRHTYVEDVRQASFYLPEFIQKEFSEIFSSEELGIETQTDDQDNESPYFNGCYDVTAVIKASNAGGVYLANDINTQQSVLIKEARPFIGISEDGYDVIGQLKKEYRLLKRVEHLGIAPKVYSLFDEWEHKFLAQELVEGLTLKNFQAKINKITHSKATTQDIQNWFKDVVKVSINILKCIDKLHGEKIVFGDISPHNIMVNEDTLEVKFIDFEGAYERGVDKPINLFTPGFATYDRLDRRETKYSDDYYALGCVILGMTIPNTTLLQLNKNYANNLLLNLEQDYGIPTTFKTIINELLTNDSANLSEIVEQLESIKFDDIKAFDFDVNLKLKKLPGVAKDYLKRIHIYNSNNTEVKSEKRALPTGPQMSDLFALDKGVVGATYCWKKTNGVVPEALLDWIDDKLKRKIEGSLPGLLNGLSGIAWALDDLGFESEAKSLLHHALHHSSLFQKMSLGYGAAGFGLTLLHFWHQYDIQSYLDQATRIADVICETAIEHENGVCWEDPESDNGVSLGLFEGGSGIALFLAYVYCVTKEPRYLALAQKGFAFDLAYEKDARGSIGFPRNTRDTIVYPYYAFGSAGIATVALRLYAITKDSQYRSFIDRVSADITHKYTINAGLATGLAGLGNFLLDAYHFLNEDRYWYDAHQVVDGLQLSVIERDDGIVFPDGNRLKVSVDFEEGSSGIALFLQRFLNPGLSMPFMLDHLIEQ